MSHGGGPSDKPMEPNLTPLLDLVLQLVMFFMLCANFVSDQINRNIELPKAVTAKSLDSSVRNVLFLNLNKNGNVLLPQVNSTDVAGEAGEGGERRSITPLQIQRYLKSAYDDKARAAGENEAKEMVVVIRVHKDADFKAVYAVLKEVKTVGFKRMQLRAIQADKSFAQTNKS